MSKASRLARPPSIGGGSKLPSPRKEHPTTGARARVLSVGEKLMRAGSDGILSRHKPSSAAPPPDKNQTETQVEAQSQRSGDRGPTVDMAPPKSRISPPKTLNQGPAHSK